MSLVRTLCFYHLLHWLHFIAYGASCVLSNVVIDDDSVVVPIAAIGCVVSAVKTPVNLKFYGVKETIVLLRGG